MDDTLHVGKHWMRLEGDILRCKYVGLISAADVQAFMLRFDKLLSAGQTYYIIADVGAVTGMEAAARRLSTEWFARHDIGGTIRGSLVPYPSVAPTSPSLTAATSSYSRHERSHATEHPGWISQQQLGSGERGTQPRDRSRDGVRCVYGKHTVRSAAKDPLLGS